MAHTKQDLLNSIKEMKAVYNDNDTPQAIKDSIEPSLKKAEKLLAELESAEKEPTAEQIVAARKAGKKAQKSGAKNPPSGGRGASMTKKQKKTLKQIVADNKKFAAYRGKSEEELRRDSKRTAKKPGSRTSASGKTYREYRANRTDVSEKAPHLAKGGIVNLSLIGHKVNTVEAHEGKFNYSVYRYGNNEYVTSVSKTGWPESFNNKIFKDQRSAVLFSERQARNYAAGGPIGEGKNGYIAFYKGKQVEVMADTSLSARDKAAAHFKAKKAWDVTVVLAEKEGQQVTHAPMFADGGTTDDPIWHNVGLNRPPANFTPEATAAFKKAIIELDNDKGTGNDSYYSSAKKAMGTLVNLVSELLQIKNVDISDSYNAHRLLQEVGIYNYKTGLLVDTSFLNKELATRKLAGGGEIENEKYEVVVGNIGTVLTTNNKKEAIKTYTEYVELSKSHTGRAADEDVTLMEAGEPIMEHFGNINDEEEYEEEGGLPDNYYVYDWHEERGSLSAYVEDKDGNEVWGFRTDDMEEGDSTPVDDGFIRHWDDINGLEKYLKSLGIIDDDATIIEKSDAENKYDHYKKGGRTTRGLSRDRMFKSQEPHEQAYTRKTSPKNPRYKKHMARGGSIMKYGESIAEKLVKHYLPGTEPNEVSTESEFKNAGDYVVYEEADGDGSRQSVISICFGDDYSASQQVIDSDYDGFSKYFTDLADKKYFNAEILSNDDDKAFSFVLTNPRTAKMARGGAVANKKTEALVKDGKMKGGGKTQKSIPASSAMGPTFQRHIPGMKKKGGRIKKDPIAEAMNIVGKRKRN